MTARILVVEDEKITALAISKQLKRLGYEVPAMLSFGEEAVETIEKLRPDLVLMDIVLKGTMDGVQAAEEIRKKANIPVVYLTAYSDRNTLERAKVTDPFGFILKPYEEREMQVAIEVALYKHQMQKRLQDSERRFATTLGSINDGVIAADLGGAVMYMNPKAEALTGVKLSEAAGRDLEAVFPLTDDPVGSGSADQSYQALAMREGAYSGALITGTGEKLPVDYSVSPMRDGHEKITGVVVVFRDISERRKAEETLRCAEERLRQSQKMEAVGRLAGGVAHDFNNLLSAVMGFAEIVLAELNPGDPLCSDIREIKRAGERAAELTRQLLAFSRRQVLQPKVLSLDELVRNMERMLLRLIGEDVELTTMLKSDPGNVKADPGQLEQVIMNLVVNARDAMPNGGKVVIETACVELDADFARTHGAVSPGPFIMLVVSDTGLGMDAETQHRIFEPFFTTKDVGQGTGLGLSTVYGIVKQSGGSIWVYSELGLGTTFKVYLPRVEENVEPLDLSTQSEDTDRGWETILVVEDDATVRTLACQVLRRKGYQVLEAADAGKALLICKQTSGPIHLLLTDVVMPRMSGRELADQLAETRPATDILFMSGYTSDAIIHRGVLNSDVELLQKPFTPQSLTSRVRKVLNVSTEARVN